MKYILMIALFILNQHLAGAECSQENQPDYSEDADLISYTESVARQGRCIVVQKQSGTHGDSSEGDGGGDSDYSDENYARKPAKSSDRLWKRDRDTNTENLSQQELLEKYTSPKKQHKRRRHQKRRQNGGNLQDGGGQNGRPYGAANMTSV